MHVETALRRFPEAVRVRVPRGFPAAVEMAARLQLTSPSEYLRRAVLHALRADGVHLDADGRVETADTGATNKARP
jgi:hypothetical protein